ncbi:Holliday junction resolvase RecU [Pseudalkalibacillus salsuginis]|uniref:Holliday junction resolvase RecU n=1 Tax=Pseudalkalibacillus salsuginis TaxID=2910972 RepID=UPI002245A650|nr:Holliday junction resolvase RecU [Pseudalkalibacillus salsuginis]
MNFHYPNRKSRPIQQPLSPSAGKLKLNDSYANRGMTFEEDINHTNAHYLHIGKSVIHKKPTPVQIVSVDYPKRSAAVIKEAYFKQPSTTDYNGVYRGRYIDFEAKETRNRTSFPLTNFHQHQIDHLKRVVEQEGICFILVRFNASQQDYLMEVAHLFHFWDQQDNGGRKSIPKTYFEEKAHLIQLGYNPRIDYLKIVDNLFFSTS